MPLEFDALGVLSDFGVAFRYEAYEEPDEPFDRARMVGQVERLLDHLAQVLPLDHSQ